MNDTCGRMYEMPLAQYDPAERCWKTSEATSLWALPMSSLTLPAWGCLRDGALYELPMPALPTIEPGFSSLPMIGTPTAGLGMGGGKRSHTYDPNSTSKRQPNPRELIDMLPTPQWRDYKDENLNPPHGQGQINLPQALATLPTPRAQNGEPRNQTIYERNGPQNLENALALLPTPAVNDMGAGKDPQAWDEWTQRMKEAHGNGNGHSKSLEQEAIGVSTRRQSLAGNTSSDEQHQPQLFNETTATA